MRPSSLYRGDEEPTAPRIEANAININRDSLDCGITSLGCCNSHSCQKLGTSKSFLVILSCVALLQGAIERYFAISVRQAALQFDYNPVVVEWLLVTSGIVQGIFSVVVSYWANRIHRISWLGALLIFQSIVSLTVIIPIVVNNNEENQSIDVHVINHLCTEHTVENLSDEVSYSVTTLAMLFVLQIGIGLGNVVFYTLGLSYMDDNVKTIHTPAIIGTALAAKTWGSQWGTTLALAVSITPLGWWLGWAILALAFFIPSVLVSLFPKRLIKTLVQQAADNIVEVASGHSQMSLSTPSHLLLADISFVSSMRRMVKNKVLIFNVLATAFVQTAMVNFWTHEASYLQSRFFVPAEWTSNIWMTLLRPGIVSMAVLLGGLIVSKIKPSARKLVIWNIITCLVVTLLFVGYIFIDCHRSPVAGAYNNRLTKPYCSRSCLCDSNIRFSPVCPADSIQTYFSPCHAGCSDESEVNGIRIFTNCTCGVDTELVIASSEGIATDGACGYADCQTLRILFQVLTIFGATILATGWVANILISLRSVLPQDKALALSIELTFNLIVYIPGHIGYQAISDLTCQYWSPAESPVCYLHSPDTFGNAMNIVSAALVLIGICFNILVYVFVNDIELYGPSDSENCMIQMRTYDEPHAVPSNQHFNITSDPGATQSLLRTPTPEHDNLIRFQFQRNRESPSISERMRLSQQANGSRLPIPLVSADHSPSYAQVHRQPDTDKINRTRTMTRPLLSDETLDHHVRSSELLSQTYGSDINPSRGSILDSESELDIAHLETSISPISDSSDSTIRETNNNTANQSTDIHHQNELSHRRVLSPETNF